MREPRRRRGFHHSPKSAATAVRAMCADIIASNWTQYFDSRYKLNAYTAAKLVQEQCNGPLRDSPITFEMASAAVAEAIPELFGEYWMALAPEADVG